MAIYSSILALENPQGQRSLEGDSRVGHDGGLTLSSFFLYVLSMHYLICATCSITSDAL